jgi:uncharacterized membrane protein
MNPTITLSHFLHLFATVVWIGGMFMILLVILPSAKATLESAPMIGGLMKEITKRFSPMANISIVVLIITGIATVIYDKNFTNSLDFSNRWLLTMFLKHIIAAFMMIIHFYRGLLLIPKIGKLSAQGEDSRVIGLQKFSLNLVKTNLAFGIIILAISGIALSI